MELELTDKPQLLIVGGPNGSGKTTVAIQYASASGLDYIGADAIAASLNPANPHEARIEAGRQFLKAMTETIASKRSCVVESTLAGRSFRSRVLEARELGYGVAIVFTYLDSVEVCIARVTERVRKGGHHVPESDIRRRYCRSIANFWKLYRELADSWVVLYNGRTRIIEVSRGSMNELLIRDALLHATFMKSVESLND